MTEEIKESKGGKNPPIQCEGKILQYCSVQFSSESPAIKKLLSTTGLIRFFIKLEFFWYLFQK
jgi:hypothetical protein